MCGADQNFIGQTQEEAAQNAAHRTRTEAQGSSQLLQKVPKEGCCAAEADAGAQGSLRKVSPPSRVG